MSARKYFVYELKKALFAIGCIALIMTAITVTAVLSSRYNIEWGYGSPRPESGIEAITFMGGVLAVVVPIWMLSYKMKKRSVDLYYALPLKRGQILRVKYLLGLIATYAPYTLAFLLGAIAAVIKYPLTAIAGEYYLAAYFATLPAMFCLYAITCFAFTRANRIIDGLVFVAFWMFALYAVVNALGTVVSKVNASLFMPTDPLAVIADYFSDRVEMPDYMPGYSVEYLTNMAVGYTLIGLEAVAATVLLFATERRSKAENIGGVSESPFGYKVMIPLLTVCTLIGIDMVGYQVFLAVIVACAAFMLTALYRHTFKIGKVQAIILVSAVVLGVVLSIVTSVAIPTPIEPIWY